MIPDTLHYASLVTAGRRQTGVTTFYRIVII